MPTRPLQALAAALLAVAALAGCTSLSNPYATGPVRLAPPTPATASLRALPAPESEIVVAVYRFRDQTGQYKPTEGASSFSTAVTQGATSILVAALQESGWFTPIERESLSNLLNERQIIQTTRSNYDETANGTLTLPPLLFAGMLLEGGIVGYDSNVLTGGAGARTLGVDASGQYRQDHVTIYLRAVSTQSGKVLKTVHTTKTILSQKVNAGVFRFVAADQLLEAEAGYTYNEPAVVAVTEAIEAAVRALILEGIRDGLWRASGPVDAALAAYDAEVAAAGRTDVYGRTLTAAPSRYSVAVAGGAERYEGDFAGPLARPSGALAVYRQLGAPLRLGVAAGAGAAAAADRFDRAFASADLRAVYAPFPRVRATPTLTAGLGALALFDDAGADAISPYALAGLGADVLLGDRLTLSLAATGRFLLVDRLDGVAAGTRNDNLFGLETGLRFGL